MYINGEPLKFLRKMRKLTREELANKSGVCERTIKLIEDGYGNPSYTTLTLLADALCIPLDILCSRNIDMYHVAFNENRQIIEYYDEDNVNRLALLLTYLQLQDAYKE